MQKNQHPVAEWVTLILSIAIVGGLAIFLIIGALKPRSDFVTLQTRVITQNIVRRGDNYLLPIELVNTSRQSVRTASVELSFEDEKQERQTRDISFDYLAAGATQRTFIAFERDPRALNVRTHLSWYQVD